MAKQIISCSDNLNDCRIKAGRKGNYGQISDELSCEKLAVICLEKMKRTDTYHTRLPVLYPM